MGMFVRSVNKMLRKLPCTIQDVKGKSADKLMHDKLHADLVLMPRYPIVTELLRYWHGKYSCTKINFHNVGYMRRNIIHDEQIVCMKIDDVSREWFHRAYGIPPCLQVDIENHIRRTGWHEVLTTLCVDETTIE